MEEIQKKERKRKKERNSAIIIQIMETQKIVNLINGSENENSKFAATKKVCH